MLQNKRILQYFTVLIVGFGLILTGCNSLSDDGKLTQNDLSIQFQTLSSSSTSAKASANMLQQVGDTLVVEGSNGTLFIDDIRFIVEDFELERADAECEDLEGADEDACEEFESEPFFVDLPLNGNRLNLDTAPIEFGLYEELEFEIDDLDLDEEDEEEKQGKQRLIDQVRQEFPDWPSEASMVITGKFVSSEGDTTAFKTFAEAEVEIELEFNPPLEVSENTVNDLIRINIDPTRWFLRPDGTAFDLSQYDFETTGQILEFEVEIKNGFESIEADDDDDDGDDTDD